MGSGGIGSGNHLSGEMFNMMAGTDLVHVPYRGAGPAMVDLMGGQVQIMFNTMSASLQHVRAGKLRALGVATKTRQAALPDVPTVAEFVPGYEASFWSGVAAPKGAPPEIVDTVNKAVNAGLDDASVKARLAEWGATALAGSPADFAKFVADETEKWGKVIRAANIKADSFDRTQIAVRRDGNFRAAHNLHFCRMRPARWQNSQPKRRISDIPPDVLERVKLSFLDGLGVCLRGTTFPWTRMVREIVQEEGGNKIASLWGTGTRTSLTNAVLFNSTAGHAFEMDDIHKESIIHPNSLAVPVVLALAEANPSLSGREIAGALRSVI